MILNYCDFINEILNNNSYYDGDMLEEAATIKNRGDVGEMLFFLVLCYGFQYGLKPAITKDVIYEICEFLNMNINSNSEDSKYQQLAIKYTAIKIDKENKQIKWTSSINHNTADKPNDILTGMCVVKNPVIDALPYLKEGTFDKEIDNCINYFTNKYKPIIKKLKNEIVEKVIICSLGPLDGDSKKEDCTVYIKTVEGKSESYSDDILIAEETINGKKQQIVKIEDCDREEWVKQNTFNTIKKHSLKNDNDTVGQSALFDLEKYYDLRHSSKISLQSLYNAKIAQDTLYNDVKVFCCVYLKMGAKNNIPIQIIQNKSIQTQILFNNSKNNKNNNSIDTALLKVFKENIQSIVNKQSVMAAICKTIVDQINNVYYKENKDKHTLLKLLLSSAIALDDEKIELFDMSITDTGYTASEIYNLIKNKTLDTNKKLAIITIESKKDHIFFSINNKKLLQIRVSYKTNKKDGKVNYRTSFYIELMLGIKNLLKQKP